MAYRGETSFGKPLEIATYAELLLKLQYYSDELGLTDKPDAKVKVFFNSDRELPWEYEIPVYSPSKCGPNGVGIKHALYNMMALGGFEAPQQNNNH